MIDVSQIQASGWWRIVNQLNASADDDREYLERLMRVLGQVSAARQSVLFLREKPEDEDGVGARVAAVWPVVPAPADTEFERLSNGVARPDKPETVVERYEDVRRAALSAMESRASRAFSTEKSDPYYSAATRGSFVLAVPLPPAASAPGQDPVCPGAITLMVENRNADAVRSQMAMAEVLTGYVGGHAARQALRRTQQASAALELAARLIASVNGASTFRGACIQLCNDLSRALEMDRVALGWIRADTVRARAISDTEHFDRRMQMVQRLEAAMDECLDQEQPVVYPQPQSDADVLLSQAITHAHRELSAGDAQLTVASLPLRVGERVTGVVTIESKKPGGLELRLIEMLQATLDLVAPVLEIRRSDDRALPVRVWDSSLKAAGWLVGPRHTAWKVAGLAVIVLLAFVTFYRTPYRVGSEAALQPRVKRIISAPLAGQIFRLGDSVEAGSIVRAGDLLVQLDTTELALQAADARAKVEQAEKQQAAAWQAGDTSKAEQARMQAARARAELDLIEHQIERSRIVSPIDGTITQGEVKQRLGAQVEAGEALLEIAPLDDLLVVARVDERDISLIKAGDRGFLATRSRPDTRFPVTIETIVPQSRAEEGKNFFEVRATLDAPASWMRPGMEGLARFDTGERSLLEIGTRRFVDVIRLWVW